MSTDQQRSVMCRICGAGVAIRITRNGFLQRRVYGFFRVYPWKCGECGVVFLSSHRGHNRSHNTPLVESGFLQRGKA